MENRKLAVLLLVGALAVWMSLGLSFWFVTDDAFISFRFARNLADGHGLRYNLTSEAPVEGFSNLLWVLIAAVVELIRLPPQGVMPLLSFLCGGAVVLVTHRIAVERLNLSVAGGAVAALATAASPIFLIWNTGGLATMAFCLLIILTFDQWVMREEWGSGWTQFILAALLILIRTEGFAWVAVFAVMVAMVSKSGGGRPIPARTFGAVLLGLVGLLVGYWLWRYSWFGDVVSNVTAAKVSSEASSFVSGRNYLLTLTLELIAPIFYLLGVFRLGAGTSLRVWLLASMAVAFPTYAMVVGGDFMAMGRFVLPSVPFAAMLLGVAVDPWLRRKPNLGHVLGIVGLIVVGILPLYRVYLVPKEVRKSVRFRFNTEAYRSEAEQWGFMRSNSSKWVALGKSMHQVTKPGDSLVVGAIGAVGYFSEREIFDVFGLVSPSVLQSDGSRDSTGKHSPGHKLAVKNIFFLPQEPTVLFFRLDRGEESFRAVNRIRTLSGNMEVRSGYVPMEYPVLIDDEPWTLTMLQRAGRGVQTDEVWEEFLSLFGPRGRRKDVTEKVEVPTFLELRSRHSSKDEESEKSE